MLHAAKQSYLSRTLVASEATIVFSCLFSCVCTDMFVCMKWLYTCICTYFILQQCKFVYVSEYGKHSLNNEIELEDDDENTV